MTVPELIAALALPANCRVDQRIPKKMLIENCASTAADRRLLSDGVDEIHWIAALRFNTVGVPVHRDDVREYLEVAVLSVTTRGAMAGANCGSLNIAMRPVSNSRLAELIHRAVPYPLLLLLATPLGLFMSMAHKRWAQNEAGKVVLDGEVTTIELGDETATVHSFLQALALARQPQASLLALYQGWMDCMTALQASHHTGVFIAVDDPAKSTARRATLRECQRLQLEIDRLRAQAGKEKQMAKQVDLNLELKCAQTELAAAREQL